VGFKAAIVEETGTDHVTFSIAKPGLIDDVGYRARLEPEPSENVDQELRRNYNLIRAPGPPHRPRGSLEMAPRAPVMVVKNEPRPTATPKKNRQAVG
jgi:hypothetical protein